MIDKVQLCSEEIFCMEEIHHEGEENTSVRGGDIMLRFGVNAIGGREIRHSYK